jgi:hypothetical protein
VRAAQGEGLPSDTREVLEHLLTTPELRAALDPG